MKGHWELAGSGGSTLTLHCLRWHFRLCRQKRLLVGMEQLPRAEPMGLNSSGAARGARGVRDLSHSNSPLPGGSGTDPKALGAALPHSSRKWVTRGTEICGLP